MWEFVKSRERRERRSCGPSGEKELVIEALLLSVSDHLGLAYLHAFCAVRCSYSLHHFHSFHFFLLLASLHFVETTFVYHTGLGDVELSHTITAAFHGMWLDRFSGHSGSPPPPQQRSYSPGPRRPTHLAPGPAQRPGFSPRTSSLSIAVNSNASTTSLASTSRLTNGSALKQQITPPPNVADPLDVLEEVVGLSLHRRSASNGLSDDSTFLNKPTSLIDIIEFDGLSLHDFARAEVEGVSAGEKQQYAVQPVEECEYVYRLVRL